MPLTLLGFVGLEFDLLNLASGAAPLGCAPRAPDSEAHRRPRLGGTESSTGYYSFDPATPATRRSSPLCAAPVFSPSISGNFATLAAMRRASSLVSRFAVQRRPVSLHEVDVGQRLPVLVADDEAGVALVNGPRRREAARRHTGFGP